MVDWLIATLRSNPELVILLSFAWGYASSQVAGFILGNVVTLLAAVTIGKLGITLSGNIKITFVIMFLFAIGYGVGSLKILIGRRHRARSKNLSHKGR
jgi:putative transport protein